MNDTNSENATESNAVPTTESHAEPTTDSHAVPTTESHAVPTTESTQSNNGKNCTHCGKEYPLENKFCPHCGGNKSASATEGNGGKPVKSKEKLWKNIALLAMIFSFCLMSGVVGFGIATNHYKDTETNSNSNPSEVTSTPVVEIVDKDTTDEEDVSKEDDSAQKENLSKVEEEKDVDVEEEDVEDQENTALSDDPREAVLGSWYLARGVVRQLDLNEDGTAVVTVTEYWDEDKYLDPDFVNLDDTYDRFTWTMEGNTVTTLIVGTYPDGTTFDAYDTFIYDPEENTLSAQSHNFPEFGYLGGIFDRDAPAVEGYLTTEQVMKKSLNIHLDTISNILGTWHYDVIEWIYNDDRTGYYYVPSIGSHPAETRNFTYTIDATADEVDDYVVVTTYEDGLITYTWHAFDTAKGIMTMSGKGDDVKFTRYFDPSNLPFTKEILSNWAGVVTGSIFKDIFLDNTLGAAVDTVMGAIADTQNSSSSSSEKTSIWDTNGNTQSSSSDEPKKSIWDPS